MNLNLGLLLGEQGRYSEAVAPLQTAANLDPKSPVAAYNLGIVFAGLDRMEEAVYLFRQAYNLQQDESKYGYTLAFYLHRVGKTPEAVRTLQRMVQKGTALIDAYMLLGEIYQHQGRKSDAIDLYRRALSMDNLPDAMRQRLNLIITALQAS